MNPKVKPLKELQTYARTEYDKKIIAYLSYNKPDGYYFMPTSDPFIFYLLDVNNKNQLVTVLHFSDTL